MPIVVAQSTDLPRWTGYVEPEPGLALPCTIIRGRTPGPKLLVVAGLHGAEYSAVEAARRLTMLPSDGLAGDITILPIVNIGAFWTHRAFFNPSDGKNLNRVFPGDAKGSASDRLAAWLTGTAMPGMDAYVDMHCGDIVEALLPFAGHPASDPRARELAIASGFPYVVPRPKIGNSIGAAAELGIPGVLLESGQNGLWTEASVALLENGVRGIMAHLGMLADHRPQGTEHPRVCRMEVATAPAAGYWHADISPGTVVTRGDRVGIIFDLIGQWEKPILAEHSGTVLYHLTSLAVNAGQALIGIAV